MSNDPWATQQQPSANPFGGQQQSQQPAWPQPGQQGQGQQQRGPQPPSLNDTLAGGGAQTAFDDKTPVGVIIRGVIADAKVQQTRFNPRFWDDGNPKWIVVVTVENAEWSMNDQPFQPLRTSPDDDGRRSFYIKTWGDNFRALQEAIKTTGHTDAEKALSPGTSFAGKHTARQRSSQGGNDELLYAYRIGGEHTSAAPGPTGAMPQPPIRQLAQPTQQGSTPQQAPTTTGPPQQTWPPQQGSVPQEEPPF